MIVLTRGLDEPVIVAGIDPAFSSLPFFRSLIFIFLLQILSRGILLFTVDDELRFDESVHLLVGKW